MDDIRLALAKSPVRGVNGWRYFFHGIALLFWLSVLVYCAWPEFYHGQNFPKGGVEPVALTDINSSRDFIEKVCQEVDDELEAAKAYSKQENWGDLLDVDGGRVFEYFSGNLGLYTGASRLADENITKWWRDASSILLSPDAVCGPGGSWKRGVVNGFFSKLSQIHSKQVWSIVSKELAAARTLRWITQINSAIRIDNRNEGKNFFNIVQGGCRSKEGCNFGSQAYGAIVCGMRQYAITDSPLEDFIHRKKWEPHKLEKVESKPKYPEGARLCKPEPPVWQEKNGEPLWRLELIDDKYVVDTKGSGVDGVAKAFDRFFSSMDGGGNPLHVTINVQSGAMFIERPNDCQVSICGIRIVKCEANAECGKYLDTQDAIERIEKIPKNEQEERAFHAKDLIEQPLQWCRQFSSSWARERIDGVYERGACSVLTPKKPVGAP